MHRYTENSKVALIEQAVETARRRMNADQGTVLGDFLRTYYAHVAPGDIFGESPDNVLGAAHAHWKFAARRLPETDLVRVYNPSLDEHGWRCEHTVVEVVADDMPFLVDSLAAELQEHGLAIHAVIHPVIRVDRNADGQLLSLSDSDADGAGAAGEAFVHFKITCQPPSALDKIGGRLERVLADTRAFVADTVPMRDALGAVIDRLDIDAPHHAPDDVAETRAFLSWARDSHFTLLGYREYAFEGSDGGSPLRLEPVPGLGILRDPDDSAFDDLHGADPAPTAVRTLIESPDLLTVAKADRRSTIHRPIPMDVIGVRRFGAGGRPVGFHMFVGLFNKSAYVRRPFDIPQLRRKIHRVFELAELDRSDHEYEALLDVVERLPREELFQDSPEHLLQTARGVLYVQVRRLPALFLRHDDFGRFIACLVYVPRDRYTTDLCRTIERILARGLSGTVVSRQTEVGESAHAQLYIIVRLQAELVPDHDPARIEEDIAEATLTWSDGLRTALANSHGEEIGHHLFGRYAEAFPLGYRDRFTADEAVADIATVEEILASNDIGTSLYRAFDAAEHQLRFKVFHRDRPIVLSHVLPMLENLGLCVVDEIPHRVRVAADGKPVVIIHDFGIDSRTGEAIDLGAVGDRFRETFDAIWHNRVENDSFNALVLTAGLTCRQVTILRAYRQVPPPGRTRVFAKLRGAGLCQPPDDGQLADRSVFGSVRSVPTSADVGRGG